MPITNFLGGVSSFGIPVTGPGVYDVPPGRVWFVCNRTGATSVSAVTGTTRDAPFLSIADAVTAIATVNPTLGDVIYVMAGHAENVTGSNIFSASLVNTTAVTIPAGTRIIGEGKGNQRPALTFTAAASTIAFAAAGCSIENVQMLCPQTGTTTVAALVTVTAAYCSVVGCDMQMASSATALCTTGISTSSAATGFSVTDCTGWGAVAGAPTSWFAPTGTVGANRINVLRNNVQLVLSATTGGIVDLSANSGTAPIGWLISDNVFANNIASSTVAMKGVASCGGVVQYCSFGITAATGGATAVNTPGSWQMDQVFGGIIGKTGISITPASG